ncbi:sigma-70 family RNA polymerase sigma factor [Clostridium sp. JS66]|nr:sigma-70 family RNA polymerase sigma factor [Clostridium sp. JS66]
MVFIIEELVKEAKSGDRAAVDEIIGKFKYFVIKQASKYSIPSYDFEDLVQHGYLSIIKSVHLYNTGRGSFTTYCTNAVINNFKALLKGQIKHYREIQDENAINLEAYDFTLEDEVIAYEESAKLKEALYKLQGTEKSIIESVYIKGTTLRKAAADCGINYRRAIKLRREALRKLRNYLNN